MRRRASAEASATPSDKSDGNLQEEEGLPRRLSVWVLVDLSLSQISCRLAVAGDISVRRRLLDNAAGHALCGAHVLRELVAVTETGTDLDRAWAQ